MLNNGFKNSESSKGPTDKVPISSVLTNIEIGTTLTNRDENFRNYFSRSVTPDFGDFTRSKTTKNGHFSKMSKNDHFSKMSKNDHFLKNPKKGSINIFKIN